MKRELPIAVVLLALGCWLTLHSQFRSPAWVESPWFESEDAHFQPHSEADSAAHHTPRHVDASAKVATDAPPSAVHPSNRSAVVQTSMETENAPSSRPVASNPQPEHLVPPDGTKSQAAQWLERARLSLVSTRPFDALMRVESWLFDTHALATGRYYQRQGGGICRLDITLKRDPQAIHLTQICDGRFMYQISQHGDKRRIDYVDLQRVSQIASRSGGTPAQSMALGGLVGLVEHLIRDYDLAVSESEPMMYCGVPVVVVTGRLKPEVHAKMLEYGALASGESNLKTLPDHIPDQVELYLGTDDFLSGFPYRITFLRSKAGSDPTTAQPLVQFNFLEVNKRSQLSPDLFLIASGDAETCDLTEDYLSQIHTMATLGTTAGN